VSLRPLRVVLLVVGLALALSAGIGRAEDAPKPLDVDEILKKVDAGLFVPDTQPGLVSYECDVSSTTSSTMDGSGKMQPDPKSAKPVAHVVVDAKAGTKTWTDSAKKKVIPGTFTPFCGPWTLTNVMRVEVDLFTTPLSKRFTADRFERLMDTDGDDFKLTFTPKSPMGEGTPQPLKPIVTRIDLAVSSKFAVTGGSLGLDQQISQDDGAFECSFEAQGALQRVTKIKTYLASFNLSIAPTLAFSYAPQSGFVLPKAVLFEIAGGQLSPSLGHMPGGGAMVSALLYDKFVVKGEPPKATNGRDGATSPASPEAVAKFLSGWAAPEGNDKDATTRFPKRVRRTKDAMLMVLVPAGTFQMGAVPGDVDAKDDEKPRHAVTLSKAYYMDESGVTNEQFARFTTATGFKTGAEIDGTGWISDESGGDWKETQGASWRAPLPGGKRPADWEKHPVVLVSWEDADAYAKWIGRGVGLPTEAQYERALRGGVEGQKYPWGDGLPPPMKYGNYADEAAKRKFPTWTWTIDGFDDGFERTSPVKSFKPNPYGLYDVSGNVWDWCADAYGPYPSGAVTDPTGPTSGAAGRVIRGGSWTGGATGTRTAYRYKYAQALRCGYVGFRLARPVTMD
jgi:sulfatase modifying factor 1